MKEGVILPVLEKKKEKTETLDAEVKSAKSKTQTATTKSTLQKSTAALPKKQTIVTRH
jgi:hypothetical protein